MEKQYIAVLDSGIGGISTLISLKKQAPGQDFIYFGDNNNAPYGNKSKRELRSLLISALSIIKSYPIKALVLGCNTLSVNFRDLAEDYLGVRVFGVFPPIEHALVNYGNTLLLSTKRTAEKYYGIKGVTVLGLENLAIDVEKNCFNLNKVNFLSHLYNEVGFYRAHNFQDIKCVIIGCTHYEFIKNQIFDHFDHQKIISGNFFTSKNLRLFLENQKSLEKTKQNEILFIL